MTEADLGKCQHAIRVKGKPNAYEIGLVARKDGRPGYSALFDFYDGGNGLMAHVSKDGARGKDIVRLVNEYSATVAIRRASRLGMRHQLTRAANGMPEKLRIFR